MKGMFLALSLMIGVAVNADTRFVSGISINIDPLHKWLTSDDKAERPLKHWKELEFHSYKGIVNGGYQFEVVIDGDTKTILLSNPPKQAVQLGTKLNDLQARLNRADDIFQQAYEDWKHYEVQLRTLLGGRRFLVTYHGSSDEREFKMLKEKEAATRAVAQLKKEKRDTLEEQVSQTTMDLLNLNELAMFTGRMIMGRALWDCGIKK